MVTLPIGGRLRRPRIAAFRHVGVTTRGFNIEDVPAKNLTQQSPLAALAAAGGLWRPGWPGGLAWRPWRPWRPAGGLTGGPGGLWRPHLALAALAAWLAALAACWRPGGLARRLIARRPGTENGTFVFVCLFSAYHPP